MNQYLYDCAKRKDYVSGFHTERGTIISMQDGQPFAKELQEALENGPYSFVISYYRVGVTAEVVNQQLQSVHVYFTSAKEN